MTETVERIDLDTMVEVAASETWRSYRDFTSREDLVQEGYLWAYTHQGTVDKHLSDEHVGIAAKRLRIDLRRAMERYARAEKAQVTGYNPDDEQFYGRKMLGELIRCVLNGIEPERPDLERVSGGSKEPDPEISRRLPLLETERALGVLTPDQYALVWDYYGDDLTQDEIAVKLGVSDATVRNRLKRALDKMVAALGGPRPTCSGGEGCAGCRACTYGTDRPSVHSPRSGANQWVR